MFTCLTGSLEFTFLTHFMSCQTEKQIHVPFELVCFDPHDKQIVIYSTVLPAL